MPMTTYPGVAQRTIAAVPMARKKKVPIPAQLLPNAAGQVGNITVGSGIINTGLGRKL